MADACSWDKLSVEQNTQVFRTVREELPDINTAPSPQRACCLRLRLKSASVRLDGPIAGERDCRRPSAVVNLNCVTNRVAQGPRYKLSYDAEQYKTIHTLHDIPYLQTAPNRATLVVITV